MVIFEGLGKRHPDALLAETMNATMGTDMCFSRLESREHGHLNYENSSRIIQDMVTMN